MKEEQKKGLRYPAINDLIEKADNKYALVLATAKRARSLIEGEEPLADIDIANPVSIATAEIDQDLVKIVDEQESSISEDESIEDDVVNAEDPDTNDSDIIDIDIDECENS